MKQSWWLSQYRIACNSGDLSAIPESGIHHGEENGNPCQCSCLENSMDRGIWWATVHGITEESDRTEWPTLTFTSYTTMKQQRETWKWNNPRNAEKKRATNFNRECLSFLTFFIWASAKNPLPINFSSSFLPQLFPIYLLLPLFSALNKFDHTVYTPCLGGNCKDASFVWSSTTGFFLLDTLKIEIIIYFLSFCISQFK